jgi:vacuolar protein sorting-associated protein 35
LGKELLKFLKLPFNINNGNIGLAPIKMSLKLTSYKVSKNLIFKYCYHCILIANFYIKDLLRQTADSDLHKQVTLTLMNYALDNGAEDNVNESDKLTLEEIETFLSEICDPLINGPKLEDGDENDEDFIDEQILLSRFIHFLLLPQCVASEELDTYYLLLSSARKILSSGGPKRIRYTFPSIVFEALRLSLRYAQQEDEERDPKWEKKCQKIFQFVHQTITAIMKESNCSDLCLRLFLQAAHNAAKTNVDNKETIAYEFISQAFSIYEEEISDSKSQLSCLLLIISTVKEIKFEIEDNYQPLKSQCCLNGAKLVKKSDQCRAILAASMLFIDNDTINADGIKCIRKCVKISSSVLDLELQLQLYVEILSHLTLLTRFNDKDVEELIRGLISKIEEQRKESTLSELIQRQYSNNLSLLKQKNIIKSED